MLDSLTKRGSHMHNDQIYIARDGKSGMHVLVRILAVDDIGVDYPPIDPDNFNKLMMARDVKSLVLAALPPMTHQLRFQVWVKGITPLSSSTTSFPISRRAISPTDGLNAPASEAAPSLLPRNSAPAHLYLSQVYRDRASIAR